MITRVPGGKPHSNKLYFILGRKRVLMSELRESGSCQSGRLVHRHDVRRFVELDFSSTPGSCEPILLEFVL